MSKYDDDVPKGRTVGGIYIQPTSSKSYDPITELASAIILQQVVDLKKSLQYTKSLGLDIYKCPKLNQAKYFFESPWFEELSMGNLDGKRVLREILDKYEEESK